MSDELNLELVKWMMTIIIMVLVLPQIILMIREGPFSETQDVQTINATILSKRVDYERGIFALKKSFVLILSDGESYKVTQRIFEMYEAGDPILIEIKNGKVSFS